MTSTNLPLCFDDAYLESQKATLAQIDRSIDRISHAFDASALYTCEMQDTHIIDVHISCLNPKNRRNFYSLIVGWH